MNARDEQTRKQLLALAEAVDLLLRASSPGDAPRHLSAVQTDVQRIIKELSAPVPPLFLPIPQHPQSSDKGAKTWQRITDIPLYVVFRTTQDPMNLGQFLRHPSGTIFLADDSEGREWTRVAASDRELEKYLAPFRSDWGGQ